MLKRLHNFRRWAGVDRAVFFSNAAQMTRLVTGLITMPLILRYLTPEIQGYFYAFSGVVAMQVFLEMGFSQNILQFASHEFAKLRFSPAQMVEGDPVAKSRLLSLGRLAFGYYAVAALIVLFALGIGGHFYFTICSNRFSPNSFKDTAAFATRLQQQSDPASKLIYEQLSPKTRQALKDYQIEKSNLKTLQTLLSKDLNAVIQGGALYDVLQGAGVNLRRETLQLQKQQPQGNALVRLNRLLLEDAYPLEIIRQDVAWQGAWWMIAVTAACALAINPAWSLLEGCNQVAVLAKFRFWASLASFAVNALALIAGAGIYASAIGAAGSLLVSVGYLTLRWKPFLSQFLERPRHGRVSWAQEIWPFQWRVAVSWMSGYFIFDIINPIALYFCGPVAAGRLGMSFQIVRMISNAAMTWVSTKAPRFGMLIAARAWSELDSLWRRSTLQAFIICLLGMISFLVAMRLIGQISFLTAIPFIGQYLPKIPARLAPFAVNAWLGGAALVQLWIGSMAMELRAHKREPYMWLSVANAVLSVAFILPLVRYWGITGEAMGYALAIWAILVPAWQIYRTRRLEYRRIADGRHEPQSSARETNPVVGNFF
jgi:O-antigen/teichoic acid export membrane protein